MLLEQQLGRVRVGRDVQVPPDGPHRRDKGIIRADPLPETGGGLRVHDAVLVGRIEVGFTGTELLPRVYKRTQVRVGVGKPHDRHWPTAAVVPGVLVVNVVIPIVLGLLEVRQHVVVAPSWEQKVHTRN